MFDPHTSFLPGATLQQPGMKIKFVGSNLAQQFPDQFNPYCFFGCDLQKSFPGTLFRFPLRSKEGAKASEIKDHAYVIMDDFNWFHECVLTSKTSCIYINLLTTHTVYPL